MTPFLQYMAFLTLIWHLKPMGAYPQSGLDLVGNRTKRDVHCRPDLEYLNGNICCLYCPAGTHKISPCTRAGEKGKCEECEDGTYTEHANGLQLCLKCTQCRSDQEVVRPCTPTQDTECQCKLGRFCAPDQACEVCKTCSRCEEDEEMERSCTSTSNTECKKIQTNAVSTSAKASVIVPLVLIAAVVIGGLIIAVCTRRHRKATDTQRNVPDGLKAGLHYSRNCPTKEKSNEETPGQSCSNLILSRQLVRAKSSAGIEEERKVLCESLCSSSASNSQHSLTGLPCSAFPAYPPPACPMVPTQPNSREDKQFPKLVPVNGEESLRKCFEYFEEIDFYYHKRFFRHLGIMDNVIKSKDHLLYDDKIHELLNIWVEKEGKEATLNDLLKALLDLNQRRTAETVKENAVLNGHYFCDNER
ncbi:hematopoietic death receptor isoform X1 [Sander lucioperca]|uniref:hematopoietic death receptor isoform X1 n=1 Tax=Sander lucioperca TaxID=283035 RepID=UPI0016538BEF|nr:hematopoietic death receptor isoform X1 [Sander lucioperca]